VQQASPDSLRAVLDAVFRSPDYDWRPDDAALSTVVRWWQALIAWIGGLRDASPLLYRALIVLLALALAAVLAHALWVLIRTIRGAADPAERLGEPAAPVRRDAGWYLRSADALAAEGRFAAAIQRAFVALALGLDARGLVQYQPSRTPAEVAREARLADPDRERLRGLVRTLYATAFGGAPFGPDDYRAWRAQAEEDWRAAGH
jgi:hypothetical protein